MALYRTHRRLNWNYTLQIGHWYAPWSGAAADTGSDYFSRTLRWLRQQYPKAKIGSCSHALPASGADWPQQRFGLPTPCDADTAANHSPTGDNNGTTAAPPAHAGDLLIIEWPQNNTAEAPPTAQASTNTSPAPAAPSTPVAPGAPDAAPAGSSTPPATDTNPPPLWVNGLERTLRRHWQDNPEAEIIFVGGTNGLCPSGLALAAHYGISTVDPVPLLRPTSPDAPDHLQTLIHAGSAGAALTPQGQEIWAGMLISLLRAQVRYGPTPEPVNLPDGLWHR